MNPGGMGRSTERAAERGEGRTGTVVGFCVLLLAVYLGFKVVPVMVNAYSFRDFIEQEARFAALKKGDGEISNRVLMKAHELDLPITAENIKVSRTATHFDIHVKYTVPIRTPVYTYRWEFDEKSRAPLF
jgi:hypothetical protein